MCESTALSLRGKSMVIDEYVNCSDTRWCWHNNLLLLVCVHVEFGSSTLTSDDDLTL